jgi:hypothetical protein
MGNRTWTDQQLRAVVPEATSWRGVLRRLGLKATSAGSMRRFNAESQSLE